MTVKFLLRGRRSPGVDSRARVRAPWAPGGGAAALSSRPPPPPPSAAGAAPVRGADAQRGRPAPPEAELGKRRLRSRGRGRPGASRCAPPPPAGGQRGGGLCLRLSADPGGARRGRALPRSRPCSPIGGSLAPCRGRALCAPTRERQRGGAPPLPVGHPEARGFLRLFLLRGAWGLGLAARSTSCPGRKRQISSLLGSFSFFSPACKDPGLVQARRLEPEGMAPGIYNPPIQVEVTFKDVAVDFTPEQWSLLDDAQKQLHKEVMLENVQHFLLLGLPVPRENIFIHLEEECLRISCPDTF
ncbi:uncharacterized protein LOC141510276 [Macrotis lagotis]|uniref:uncharacterized protein LOC141510276 n=1 Tax=Macrotis lagotis TaxID=92651 RepID=UPI003D6955E1